LVDFDGFPREDLDFGELSTFRNLKRKLCELNNDHIEIMKKLEKEIVNIHLMNKDSEDV